MAKLQGTFIGSKLTRILRVVKQSEAGWYIQAALALIEDGVYPANKPAKYLAGWTAIEEEIQSIRDLRETRREIGRMGGAPRGNSNAAKPSRKTTKNNQTGTKNNQAIPQNNPKQPDTDTDTDTEKGVNSDGIDGESQHPRGRAKSPSPIGPSEKPIRPRTPGIVFDKKAMAEDSAAYIFAVESNRLPELAVWYCGEPENAEAKTCYGGFVRDVGDAAFRDLLSSFVSECNGGERPRNIAAAFHRKVKVAYAYHTARQSLAGASCSA